MTDLLINKIPNSDLVMSDSAILDDSFSGGEKFIVFSIGNEFFAVSAQNVSEVIQPLEVTYLPNVPKWLFGITNLRGEIISIINLLKLWQIPSQTNIGKPNLIILRGKNNSIALASDKLSEIISLPFETIELCEEDSHFFGNAIYKTKNLQIIDFEKLFTSINLAVKSNISIFNAELN